jgi:hypothetical protein
MVMGEWVAGLRPGSSGGGDGDGDGDGDANKVGQ